MKFAQKYSFSKTEYFQTYIVFCESFPLNMLTMLNNANDR